jgi:hypothetical protein
MINSVVIPISQVCSAPRDQINIPGQKRRPVSQVRMYGVGSMTGHSQTHLSAISSHPQELEKPNRSQPFNWRRAPNDDTETSGRPCLTADTEPVGPALQGEHCQQGVWVWRKLPKEDPCKCTKALNPDRWAHSRSS